jgi:hypothetical protein
MLVSYNLGARNSVGQMTAPTTQMMVGPDGIARPYLVQAGQAGFGQAVPGQYGWSPYSTTTPGAVAPMGYAYPAVPAYQPAPYPAQTQYVTERAVVPAPVRRVSTQRVSSEVKPRRTWQKSALLIGGSAGAGAGVGALIGGKKGALSGAAIGGGAAAIYDQIKRH